MLLVELTLTRQLIIPVIDIFFIFFLQQTHSPSHHIDEGYLPFRTSSGAPPVYASLPARAVPEESWAGGAFPKKDYLSFPSKKL